MAQIASIFDLLQSEDDFAKQWAKLKEEPEKILSLLSFEARCTASPLFALAIVGWLFSVDINSDFTEERGRQIYQWLIKHKNVSES